MAVAEEEVCDHHTTQIYSRAQLVLRPLEVLLKNETLNALNTWYYVLVGNMTIKFTLAPPKQ